MTNKLKFVAACFALSASACSLMPQPTHNVTEAHPEYDPKVSARIRLLTSNGTKNAAFRPNSSCYRSGWEQDPDKVVADDGFLAAWKYSSQSVVIGMPPSPRKWMRPDGLVFKDAIREYVVDGGKPVTLMTSESGTNGDRHWRCEPSAMTFTPVAGQDYDIYQEMGRKACWISIRHIDAQGLDELVKGAVAQKCADSAPTAAQNRSGP